jgi:hypothetical protein
MATRPFTDITKIKDANPVKNGTLVVSTTVTGRYKTNDSAVLNVPTIATIDDKYGYRFYNGIFVELVGNQTVVGG